MPTCRNSPTDSFDFAKRMLEEAHVAATPGVDFDPVHGRAFIRFSYARSADEMRESRCADRAVARIDAGAHFDPICRHAETSRSSGDVASSEQIRTAAPPARSAFSARRGAVA